MADYTPEMKSAFGTLDQMIAQQNAILQQKPTGILGNVDPVMLGLAQGFLSPTRTGGFGESVGAGLRGAEGPLSAIKKQQTDAQNKIMELQLAKAKLAMEAPYWQRRGLGTGSAPSERSDLLAARDYDTAAMAAKAEGDFDAAAAYAAKAKELRDRHLTPLAKAAGADAAKAAEAKDAEAKAAEQSPGFFESMFSERAAEGPVTGGDVAESIATQRGIKTEGRKKWLEEQKKQTEGAAPEEAKGQAPAAKTEEAPAEETQTNYYMGDTPPKQFPQAQKAPDGKWYVVKDGKYRPVMK